MIAAADLASSCELVVIGGGPAGLAAAALAARAGVSTVLFDENPGVGGQIYRAITSTPVTDRAILGDDYWDGAKLADEATASGALIVNGATVWSLDRQRLVGVSVGGKARVIEAGRVIIATGSQERPFPIPGWTLPGVMTAGAAQTALKAQGLVVGGRTVMAGSGPLLWLLAAQTLRAGGKIDAILDTTPRRNWLQAIFHLPDFALSPYFAKGLALLREVRARVPVHRVDAIEAVGTERVREVVFSGAARVTWDRCFVNVSGFSFDTDGNTPGFRTSASWWDVSVDVGYALWRPFNDQPTPWSGVRHWEGNEAKDGGYRFELAIAPTLGFSWDDASVSVDSVGAGPSTSIDGGWAAIRFGGEFVATLHTKDVVGFLQSIDIYADFSAGPSFGVSGDADGTGLYVMLEAGGRIFFTPNIAAHLGYRLTDGDFDVSSGDQANIGLQGLFAGATIRF